MKDNAYILDWAMDDYEGLKQELSKSGLAFTKENDVEHIRVQVPIEKVGSFAQITQKHLNAPQNYIDLQFPENKKTLVIFRDKIFTITNDADNEEAKGWAISIGLPKEQANWATSF